MTVGFNFDLKYLYMNFYLVPSYSCRVINTAFINYRKICAVNHIK